MKIKIHKFRTPSGEKVEVFKDDNGIPRIKLEGTIVGKIKKIMKEIKRLYAKGFVNMGGTYFFPHIRPERQEEKDISQ
jgi:hypothetical protein